MKSLDPTQAKRAAIYVRVSDRYAKDADERGQETSLDTQEAGCRAHAAAAGYAVADGQVYREKHTGVELWERDELTRLREAIRQRVVDVVVCHSIDRLSRDPVHLGVIITEAQHHRARVEFVTEPLDDTPEGELVRYVRGYAAKIDHAKRREATMRGRLASARAGKVQHGARPRYGYRWNDDKTRYLEDPITGRVVRRLFAESLAGASLRGLAIALTDEKIPSPMGRPAWDFSTVSRILRDPVYAGQAVAFRTKRVKDDDGNWRVHQRDEDERLALPAGAVPPLVDVDTFAGVVAHLPRHRQQSVRRAADPEAYLLRGGYVKCGHCGATMVVNRKNKGTTAVYACTTVKRYPGRCGHHGISTAILDQAAWAKAEEAIWRSDKIDAELERREREGDPTTEADLRAVDAALADVEKDRKRRARLLERLDDLDDEKTLADIKGGLRTLIQRRTELEAAREAVLRRREKWEAKQARRRAFADWARRVREQVVRLDYAGKRLAIEACGIEATVWRTDHSPRVKISIDPELEAGSVLQSEAGTSHRTPLITWLDGDALAV